MKGSLFYLILFISQVLAIKVYKSTIPLQIPFGTSALEINTTKSEPVITDSLSICLRFNLKRLKLILIEISDPINDDLLLQLRPMVYATWFGFGNIGSGENSSLSWMILKDFKTNSLELWKINQWHHFCATFVNGKLTIIKVTNSACYKG